MIVVFVLLNNLINRTLFVFLVWLPDSGMEPTVLHALKIKFITLLEEFVNVPVLFLMKLLMVNVLHVVMDLSGMKKLHNV